MAKSRVTMQPTRAREVSTQAVKMLNPDAWREGLTTAQRGYGGKWQRARLAYLAKHPLCVFCQQKGLVTAANVVDHIIDHKGDQALFWDKANWQPLCQPCHDSDKRILGRAIIKKDRTMIYVITGPTCGGKSTYVQQHKAANDVVIDFDKLAQALGASRSHKADGLVKAVAFEVREAAIDYVLKSSGGAAWIIHTRPSAYHLRRYASVGAKMVTVNPGLDTCLARAIQDARPAGTEADIREWFERAATARGEAIDFLLSDVDDT